MLFSCGRCAIAWGGGREGGREGGGGGVFSAYLEFCHDSPHRLLEVVVLHEELTVSDASPKYKTHHLMEARRCVKWKAVACREL